MLDLADRIEGRAAQLAEEALAEMYRDPFWEARYGERGRRFSHEDGHYHVRYLVEALRSGTPETLCAYARWLQTLLTSRGMCTAHLVENFERIGAKVGSAVEGSEAAVAYLKAAVEALRYPEGAAREVQDAAEAMEAQVRAQVKAQEGAADERQAPEGIAGAGTLLSYLIDAIARDRPELFGDHLLFAADYLGARGAPPALLEGRLDAIEASLALLPEGAPGRALAAEVVDAARGRIRQGAQGAGDARGAHDALEAARAT
ncbi:hypothetical protein [Chondromyces apiculatus]|uniref:Uncharacterized protein n=1 Tax=Chondromyces apiculatus DSM 436 TaxID=1192034 RepID=A0A017TC46_9BACT|nr:hypothetical protein [Chondromyces apiculatus]EYF06824.1 Hypothetical protein CAP_1521 [Chondromyces apiculatus DSM 436]